MSSDQPKKNGRWWSGAERRIEDRQGGVRRAGPPRSRPCRGSCPRRAQRERSGCNFRIRPSSGIACRPRREQRLRAPRPCDRSMPGERPIHQGCRSDGSGADVHCSGVFATGCGPLTRGHRRRRGGECPTTWSCSSQRRGDGVGMEGVEIAPRPLGQVEAPGEGEHPGDEGFDDGPGDEGVDVSTSQHGRDHLGGLVAGQLARGERRAVTNSARLSTSRSATTGSH